MLQSSYPIDLFLILVIEDIGSVYFVNVGWFHGEEARIACALVVVGSLEL